MNPGGGIGDLRNDTAIAIALDERANRWPCFSCLKPREVVYFAPSARRPDVFDCPHNRYAPHAGSDNCPHFEQIPDIEELWS